MGKGGYNGGSTILYLRKTEDDLKEKIHYKNFLEGCMSCGESYNPEEGKTSHTCIKCGKVILLSLRGRSSPIHIPKKNNKKKGKNKKIKTKDNKCTSNKKSRTTHRSFGLNLGELLAQAIENKKKL